ncbi:Ppx/GppA phosphatase family protein [Haliea sp. E1-2-M8]|uniref:Ppx/GppA phosphatase family protein n=1 Tax=Haliea sp. E1-2-M8 TaxID=3064706 RepID=UPI0027240DD8|nr:Ppx/GppA phosphatase family protein [Haliea sp. E1-2-M8]MDO8863215.1 Ppx/GppA phosphatase family protein [Haliea sp. E1-2-M8]
MEPQTHEPLPDGSLLAAVDLGSNSFHLIVARVEHGEMRPVEVLAEKVQLGAGLVDNRLSPEAIERGLDCLARFAQMLGSVEAERIRVVGTNALRVADNRREFTRPAQQILGAPVDVVYGREEARLVYLGVAHSLADDAQSRLVIDIGGGSTELIIGQRFEPQHLESLQMGCVSYSDTCFPGGKLSKDNYRHAYNRARLEVSHIRYHFHSGHWAECVGSSGTLQAIEAVLASQGWSDGGGINRKGLEKLEKRLLRFKRFDNIALAGLSSQRRNVIAAGVAIASAMFDELGIKQMRTSRGALREGVIYDLMGRFSHEDVRERTINALMQRYGVDTAMAELMARRARTLFNATRSGWKLRGTDGDLLQRTALAHEIGMAISHKHYQRHSAYLLLNTDLPGFSQEEQEQMALLAATQRGKLDGPAWAAVADSERPRLLRLITLIRLALIFKYVEQLEALPDFAVAPDADGLRLEFPAGWLAQHPLTAQELQLEQAVLAKQGLALAIC